MAAVDFQMRSYNELVQIINIYNGSSEVETGPFYPTWIDRIDYKWIENYELNQVVKTKQVHSPPPHGFELAKGYLHSFMHRDFVQYALNDQRAQDFLKWSAHTFAPDEMCDVYNFKRKLNTQNLHLSCI